MIRIGITDTGPLLSEEKIEKAFRLVSERRIRKVQRLRFLQDKALQTGAELLLFSMLREAGFRDIPYEITENAEGKPRIGACPGVHFSISHSGSYAAAAISDAEIGCDIEIVSKPMLSIADRFFHESERTFLNSAEPGPERDERFYRIWTLKESLLKADGRGLLIPLDSFGIVPEDPNCRLYGGDFGRDYKFKEYPGIPGYCFSVCSEKDGFPESPVFYAFNGEELPEPVTGGRR